MWLIGLMGSVLVGYMLGSIPSGYLAGRLRGVDLRREGSGNVGATNAVRVLGRGVGIVVFVADFLKGIFAVWLASMVGALIAKDAGMIFGMAGGVSAVLGHVYPVWLSFAGGKGIATSGAVIVALYPWQVFVTGFVVWVVLFFATRYVSVASLGAAVSLPIVSGLMAWLGLCDVVLVAAGIFLAGLAIWKHRSNIERLLAGTENRFVRRGASSERS